MFQLLDASDVQSQLAEFIQQRRKALKLSRQALADKAGVPAPTIKRFETTGQISLRQLLLLWQVVDELPRFASLTDTSSKTGLPKSLDEVINGI